MIARRGLILGLGALVAAPAIIRVAPLMQISSRHMLLPYKPPDPAFIDFVQHINEGGEVFVPSTPEMDELLKRWKMGFRSTGHERV